MRGISLAKGKLLKTKIKELVRLTKAKWKLAQKKPIELSIREHIGKFLDNIKMDDVGFIVAWIGVAFILAQSIEFLDKLMKDLPRLQLELAEKAIMLAPFMGKAREAIKAAKAYLPEPEQRNITIEEWLVIFAVAYLIVKHFGAIMQTVGDISHGVTKLGLSLLG